MTMDFCSEIILNDDDDDDDDDGGDSVWMHVDDLFQFWDISYHAQIAGQLYIWRL